MTDRSDSYRALTLTGRLVSSTGFILAAAAVISFLVYCLTCFPTITWWKSAVYSLTAVDLGVAHPPGSLLTTILGWIVARLAVCGSVALALNLFTGFLAALTVGMIVAIAAGLPRSIDDSLSGTRAVHTAVLAGAGIGGLTLAFSQTLWLYATKFTPYMLTAFFTGLTLAAIIGWWNQAEKRNSLRWLILVTFLFGLDFSVHRTNLLMAPGFFILVLMRRPAASASIKTWLFGALGLAAGLSFHFLLIPMAAGNPFLNSNDPCTLSRFWNYVSLKQFGGGFLVNILPRKAPFWRVQVADYLKAFSVNLFGWQGKLPFLGFFPAIFGLLGLGGIWRRNRRFAAGMVILFMTTSLGAVIYFNVPENFFRSMYRHYLPSFFIFSVWVAYGVGSVLLWSIKFFRRRTWISYTLALLLLAALPGYQLASNYKSRDASKNYFAYDYAQNFFLTLPENAILFTYGDNDTHPLWYLQVAKGLRTDVTVLNVSLLNTSWYIGQIIERDINLPLKPDESGLNGIRTRPWTDTTIAIPAKIDRGVFRIPEDAEIPDSIFLQVSPDIADKFLLPQHLVMLDIIKNNNWQRPIYFSTGGHGRFPPWIRNYLRPEGLAFRLIPVPSPPENAEILRENLLERYSYRGYADDDIIPDNVSRQNGFNYLSGFLKLAQISLERDDTDVFQRVKKKIIEFLPPDRLRPLPNSLEKAVKRLLDGGASASGDKLQGLTDQGQ
jgi:hypothetical protein